MHTNVFVCLGIDLNPLFLNLCEKKEYKYAHASLNDRHTFKKCVFLSNFMVVQTWSIFTQI